MPPGKLIEESTEYTHFKDARVRDAVKALGIPHQPADLLEPMHKKRRLFRNASHHISRLIQQIYAVLNVQGTGENVMFDEDVFMSVKL